MTLQQPRPTEGFNTAFTRNALNAECKCSSPVPPSHVLPSPVLVTSPSHSLLPQPQTAPAVPPPSSASAHPPQPANSPPSHPQPSLYPRDSCPTPRLCRCRTSSRPAGIFRRRSLCRCRLGGLRDLRRR